MRGGIALALFLMLYRRRRSLDASDWQELREPACRRRWTTSRCRPLTAEPDPTLTPAGAPARTRPRRRPPVSDPIGLALIILAAAAGRARCSRALLAGIDAAARSSPTGR